MAGTKVDWVVGWSDGTSLPTADSNCGAVVPATRSFIHWNGYISDLPFDFALNAVVTSNMTIQLSDFPTFSKKV